MTYMYDQGTSQVRLQDINCYGIWNREHMHSVNIGTGYENIKDKREEKKYQ